MLLGKLAHETDKHMDATRIDKERPMTCITHQNAHALQHTKPMIAWLLVLLLWLEEKTLLHQQLERQAKHLPRLTMAEVITLCVLHQKLIHFLFLLVRQLLSERMTQQADELHAVRHLRR